MESPLTQDARPSFQPKIVSLYERLFSDDSPDDRPLSEGYWSEFFLHRAHASGLHSLLSPLSPDEVLDLSSSTRQLFARAVAAFKAGQPPKDEIALDTLDIFLKEVLAKKYTNASSDIITVLTGLESVDQVFTDFVQALDGHIRAGRSTDVRRKAVKVALRVMSGAYGTGLGSYFMHRDLFPAIMKFVNDPDTMGLAFEPFVLLGVLANYNKFEFQNPYQLRLNDFVNEPTIQRIVQEIGDSCIRCRADYTAIQDDLPEGWSLNSMLSYVGLTILSGAGPKPPPVTTDVSKLSFATLPNSRATILLGTYDFVHANKLFASTLVNFQPSDQKLEPPICAFLSLTSYLLHHAHRSSRPTLYARTNLLVLRLLLEDPQLCSRLLDPELSGIVRLCRQKPPHLPIVRGKRLLLPSILDLLTDALNHNLKKKLDVDLYLAAITCLSRATDHLAKERVRLDHHWPHLWRALLTTLRFLTTYVHELQQRPDVDRLLETLPQLIASALATSDAFLNPNDADDLFYKLVESGPVVERFCEAWKGRETPAVRTLMKVSEHYGALLEKKGAKSGKKAVAEVMGVIREGYETLEVGGDGVGAKGKEEEGKFRESEERAVLKRVGRMVVADLDVGEG